MKVAISLFKDRVSPHFSTAPEALIVLADGARICATLKIDLALLSLSERRGKFFNFGIEVLFCGGIDTATREWFEKHGIRVEDNRMGNAMEILNGHLNARNHSKQSGG